ncbi:MAG: hypothetical protein II453_11410 [Alphaproteobacteria bacterium]|nr:hypothetical protein [Alphaproteobacteria bacterium]
MKWIDGDKLLFRLEQYRKFVEQVEDNYLALMVFNSVEREIKKLEEEGIEKCKSCKEMARLWTWPGDTKHGYWTKVGDNSYKCSVCGEISCCTGDYCSDCGARMDEEEDEEGWI